MKNSKATITGTVEQFEVKVFNKQRFITFKIQWSTREKCIWGNSANSNNIKVVAKTNNIPGDFDLLGDWVERNLKVGDNVTVTGALVRPMALMWLQLDDIEIHKRDDGTTMKPTKDFLMVDPEEFNLMLTTGYAKALKENDQKKQEEIDDVKRTILASVYEAAYKGEGYVYFTNTYQSSVFQETASALCERYGWTPSSYEDDDVLTITFCNVITN